VIIRDPADQRETRFYFATDQSLSGLDIVLADHWPAGRQKSRLRKAVLIWAFRRERQWSDAAIERCTPRLLAIYSLVTLWVSQLYPKGDLPIQQTAWYRKSQATFSDVLTALRFCLWNPLRYPALPENPDVILLPRSEIYRLVAAACSSP